jgi:hypothetical protein
MTIVALRLTARQWATIDGTMDNLASNSRANGLDGQPALEIREAGWRQVPWVGPDKKWPPFEEIITITLRRDQWDLAVRQLATDQGWYEEIGDQESLRCGRDAEQAISRQLP